MAGKAALLVVDMLKDGVERNQRDIGPQARAILPKLQQLLEAGRAAGVPVIYACDSFMPGDFLFRDGRKPHSLRGTPGAAVADAVAPQPGDLVMEKRRMSSFFKTDLDITLRTWGVETVLVTGLGTHVCVLLSALDAVANDFYAVIVEDCCAAPTAEIHQRTVENYRRAMTPLLQVMTAGQVMEEFGWLRGA